MTEFELKFQVPVERRSAVHAFVAGRRGQRSRKIRLQAAYFDTPDRLLARHAMALRLRREGDEWVQTLKGAAGDGLERQEHNVALADERIDFASPRVDPARHAEVAVGKRLLELLAGRSADDLQCRYRSDVRRTVRELSTRFGRVELAFDDGALSSGDGRLAILELEIELLDGHPFAVLDVARRWALRHRLWLDVRSKAQRGDMLAGGVVVAPPVRAGAVRLRPDDRARDALRAAIADCRRQILGNASQVADGRFDAEHVHQLRVGLRRLRTALRLFDADGEAAALARPLVEPAATMFRGLAVARDQAVRAQQLSVAIETAWRASGQPAALLGWASEPIAVPPTVLVRSEASQRLLLDLIGAGLPAFVPAVSARRLAPVALPSVPAKAAGAAEPKSAAAVLGQRLPRWHRAVARDAARFEQLDDAARHRLRKRIKRLVYGIGFAAGVFRRKPSKRLLDSLKPVQSCLGELNDVVSAAPARADDGPIGWFAAGWLSARRDALLAEAIPLLRELAAHEPNWKRIAARKRGR